MEVSQEHGSFRYGRFCISQVDTYYSTMWCTKLTRLGTNNHSFTISGFIPQATLFVKATQSVSTPTAFITVVYGSLHGRKHRWR